jgi:hypothetical protein
MNGIVDGIAGNAIWSAINAAVRRGMGRQIEITSPRPLETLSDPEPLGAGVCFKIYGRLKRLSRYHKIWLLTQGDTTGDVWPQGFFPVQYDPERGTWVGKINGMGKKQVRIVAVVAPLTSQDYFRYFQTLGVKR